MRQESNIKDQGRGARPRPFFVCRGDLWSVTRRDGRFTLYFVLYSTFTSLRLHGLYPKTKKSRTARKPSCFFFYNYVLVLLHADRNLFAVDVPILFIADCFAKNDIVCKNVMRNSRPVLVNNSHDLFAAAYRNSDVIHYLKA